MVWRESPQANYMNVNYTHNNNNIYPYSQNMYFNRTGGNVPRELHFQNYNSIPVLTPQRNNNTPASNSYTLNPAYKEKLIIQEIEKRLAYEAENAHKNDLLSKLHIDLDTIHAFDEYAKYLENVNPICSPDSVDTPEKLVVTLGI